MEKIEGVSLLISKYKDNDAIINILTNNGLVSVLGRGILNYKSKNFIFSSPFTYAEYEIYRGNVGGNKLKTGKIYKIFNDSTNDYSKLLALNFFSEIILKTIDGIDEFSTLYKNTLNFLESINQNDIFKELAIFTIKLTHLLGIDILIIGSKYLDYTNGKLTNTKTENSFSLNENDVNFLKEVYNKNIPSFEANYLKIITIIALFLQNQFDIKLNSIDLLNNY